MTLLESVYNDSIGRRLQQLYSRGVIDIYTIELLLTPFQ
jgi:hypothetical protein